MKISRRGVLRLVYTCLASAIVWQATMLVKGYWPSKSTFEAKSVVVRVNGDVEHPGSYRVAEGTTHFEILRVAGIKATSDLSPFDLARQVESGEDISVGQREGKAGLDAPARLEFFFGSVEVAGGDGVAQAAQEGIAIEQGDAIKTGEKAQAEISVSNYSRLDMDSYCELSFDKVNQKVGSKLTTEVYHKSGFAWYRIVYTKPEEMVKIVTPFAIITAAGKGAEFTVDLKYTEVSIDNSDGLVLIERLSTGEALNVVSGQRVTIYDDDRPFQVTRLDQEESNRERFADLGRAKSERLVRNLPLNFLFCTLPSAYHIVSVQFNKKTVYAVRLPRRTGVSQFAHGFATLEEAFLHGGTTNATDIAERLLNVRIPKYMVFDKDDLVQAASIVGGVNIELDAQSASSIGAKTGGVSLSGQQLIDFMKPSTSGSEVETERRQMVVLKALFKGLKSKNIVLTAMMLNRIFSGIETNMTASEAMKHYQNFSTSAASWKFITLNLPTTSTTVKRKTIEEPDLEKSRKLLHSKDS